MMDMETKKSVQARLRRIAGQVQGVERMLDADRSSGHLMHQLAAVQAAVSKVGEAVFRSSVVASGRNGEAVCPSAAQIVQRHMGERRCVNE